MKYKILVVHPGKQHSYRLASALKKGGLLYKYITTIYNKEGSIFNKIIKIFLSEDNKKRLESRKNKDLIDNEVLELCKYGGLIETLLYRIDKNKRIYNKIHDYNADRFGLKVAKYAIKNNIDIVIAYDTNALVCFEYLKNNSPSIIKVLDVSIIARPYMKEIYEKECKKTKTNYLYNSNLYLWNKYKMSRLQKEIDNSDYFLAASNVVRDSLIYSGVKKEQVKLVPYGANVISNLKKSKLIQKEIRFLFVGQVVYRKGISYLLECMEELENSKLTIVGNCSNEEYILKYKNYKNIKFTGLVTFDKMKKIYETNDVFIIPSFAEGMAQVGIEAMACGLPVICTYNSGISDLIIEGENGFVVKAGNKEELLEKMKWFIKNNEKIIEMGEKAKEISKKYTWKEYEKNIINCFLEILKSEKNEKDEL